MYIAHEHQRPLPPPLSMDPPHPIDRNSVPYQPSSASSATMLPSLPRSPQDLPLPTSTVDNGRIYSLDVIQQPIRARMCGFGDKDRRPITPPPCIRLVVRDAATNKELDINEIDTSYYVLTVDLWSHDGTREVNLVRHSATSPSISAATSSSYPPPPPTPPSYQYTTPLQQVQIAPGYGQPPLPPPQQQQHHLYQPISTPYQHPYQQPPANSYHTPQVLPPPPLQVQQHQAYYTNPTGTPITPTGYYQQQMQQAQGPLLSHQQLPPSAIDPRSAPSGMFTRNLIGSLCVSAFKLTNPDGHMGVWFILQDLSVRTEGSFRLKMNFVNVGSPSTTQSLNNGSAPVLASCFSDVFQVFSAKKFPGVIESTALSKIFATQGIKIPIRKDGPRGNVREREGEEDE